MADPPDRNVISEIGRARPNPVVQGIERLRRRDPGRAHGYTVWLGQLQASYADRIVPVDVEVAAEWGRLNGVTRLPVVDGLLAATARVRGWTLVTRKTRDVARTGARLLDPFVAPA